MARVRPATGNRNSHEANNLFEGLLYDVTDQPERSLHFQKKGEGANPYLISKWEPDRNYSLHSTYRYYYTPALYAPRPSCRTVYLQPLARRL